MHAIYDLKETLCRELEEYGQKDKLDVGDLDIVDKLAHATKNLDKIIEAFEEQEYSSRGYNDIRSYRNGGRNYNYNNGGSYARGGRRSYRRNYSMDSGMIDDVRELMMEAPDDRTRQKFQKLIDELEQM